MTRETRWDGEDEGKVREREQEGYNGEIDVGKVRE